MNSNAVASVDVGNAGRDKNGMMARHKNWSCSGRLIRWEMVLFKLAVKMGRAEGMC